MTLARLSVVAAAAVLAFAPHHASAASKAFCSGKLVADSFYPEVRSQPDGKTSQVTYWMQLRNTTNGPVKYRVFFDAQQSRQRAAGVEATVNQYGSAKIKLGVDTFGNPSGNGQLDKDHDLPNLTRVTCQ